MNKWIRIFSFLIIVLFGNSYRVNAQTVTVKASFNGFHCDGKPGLCAFELSRTQDGNGNLSLVGEQRQMRWEISKEALSTSEEEILTQLILPQEGHPESRSISFPADVAIATSIAQQLGSYKTLLWIKEGVYNVHQTATAYILILTLR